MDRVIERSLARLPAMYRAFLRQCNVDFQGDTLIVYAPDSVTLSRISTSRVTTALVEESGAKAVRFALDNTERLPLSDMPLPGESLPQVDKRGKCKAVETVYDGYRFRSRLEARWAVFFHEARIQYQYEPEGFQGFNGAYLPDFYLPKYKVYVEVKGTDEALVKDAAKIAGAIDYHMTPVADGLLILGEIPNYEKISVLNIPMFPYLYHSKGIIMEYAAFYCEFNQAISIAIGNRNVAQCVFHYDLEGVSEPSLPDLVSVKCAWTFDDLKGGYVDGLKKCYKKARQARFEHGENGGKQ